MGRRQEEKLRDVIYTDLSVRICLLIFLTLPYCGQFNQAMFLLSKYFQREFEKSIASGDNMANIHWWILLPRPSLLLHECEVKEAT
jgi:hypothetical protein